MRKVVLQLHVTLDGFADGKYRIVPDFGEPYWKELDQVMARTGAADVDTILLGRGTYREWAGYWPKALEDPDLPAGAREAARFFNTTPKYVFSRSLKSADWEHSTIVRGDIGTAIARLKRRPGKNLLVPGGVRFPRALIEKNLVDEYLLTLMPMVMGHGPYRLFGEHARPRNLRLIDSHTFRNGALFLRYEPARG